MKEGENYARVRELYSQIAYALTGFGPLYQASDVGLIVQAAVNYQIWEDCMEVAMDKNQRVITETKSHTAKEGGKVAKTLLINPVMKIMKEAESSYRTAINLMALNPMKRAAVMSALSIYNSAHGNGNVEEDPFSDFWVASEPDTEEFYK